MLYLREHRNLSMYSVPVDLGLAAKLWRGLQLRVRGGIGRSSHLEQAPERLAVGLGSPPLEANVNSSR